MTEDNKTKDAAKLISLKTGRAIAEAGGDAPQGKGRRATTTKEVLQKPSKDEEFFTEALNSMGVSYNYEKEAYYVGGLEVLPDELFARLILRGSLSSWIDGISEPKLHKFLKLWKLDQEREVVRAYRDRLISYDDVRGTAAIRQWVDLVCREGDTGKEYTTVMVKQWLWQVKRSLMGLPRWDHVMLVLQGNQENGKSTSALGMLSPLGPLMSKWSLDAMSDDRNYLGLQRTYAGYVTEIVGRDSKGLGKLKELLTADRVSFRLLATHSRVTVNQNCSFIADTNESVAEVFQDLENRRFWEIRFRDKEEMDLDALRTFPYREMWYAVGAGEINPLQASGRKQEIREAQNTELTTLEPFDAWVLQTGVKTGKHKINATKLYKVFASWCTAHGYPGSTLTSFGRKAKRVFRCLGIVKDDDGDRGMTYSLAHPLTKIKKLSK